MLIDKKILLVEDDDFIRQLFEIYLKDAGYIVVSAIDGQDGINKFKKEYFDLVLLDILLPIKDGITSLQEMMAHNKAVPVVMLTNLASDDMIQRAFTYGAVGYLIKSRISKDDMVNEVKGFIESNIVV